MSELQNFYQEINLESYMNMVTTNNFENLPETIKGKFSDHINNLKKSKSARKKEIKIIKSLIKKMSKQNTENKKDIDFTDNKEYMKYRMELFEKHNINPYPHYFETNYNIKNFSGDYNYLINNQIEHNTILKINGRIISKRISSKNLCFYTIEYEEENLQILSNIYFYKDEEEFKTMNMILARGDFIGIEGYPHRSKTNELSIIPLKLTLLSPCLSLLPKNIKDAEGKQVEIYSNKESRFRNRHLDWILNPKNREIIKTRSKIIRMIRNYFDDRDFIEVETPTLNLVSAGANARPFTTYINAFNMPVYLRIAPELKLKQMIIGGFNKVYEIGKQYRNEDVDRTHLPEFTSIEFYQQGADYHTLMDTTEELISGIVKEIHHNYRIKYIPDEDSDEVLEIDFRPPFNRIDMKVKLEEILKSKIEDFEYPKDMFSEKARQYFINILEKLNVECSAPQTMPRLLDKLVGEFIEPECINPTFIINHFQVMSPLAKYHREDDTLTERFELFVARKELCNAFTELNNPLVQQKLFEAQVEDKKLGDDEAQMKDDEFIEAMKYGLPPTGGWGMGIDRLTMFLTNQQTIREVVTYPTMKPL